MSIKICPSKASGRIKAPPSKSCAHRLLVCAALAEGESVINGLSDSQDILATGSCIAALGASCAKNGDSAAVRGSAGKGTDIFPCRESGSTLRFLIPVVSAVKGKGVFTGSRRLMERGVGIYEELFSHRGVTLQKTGESLSLTGKLPCGEYAFRGDVSSQFVSGLMFALPLIEGDSVVKVLPPVESRAYIDLTVSILRRFGIEVLEREENCFYIRGGQRYRAAEATVEGDWSNAAFFFALNELGASVEVSGLDRESLQSDRICTELFARLRDGGAVIDISGCPDLGPVMFATAAANKGGVFTGTRRLRIKESDRAEAMAQELRKLGAEVTVEENRVTIGHGGIRRAAEPLFGHNDHRIAMALSVLASAVGGEIQGAAAVRKSYPDFFDALRALGVEVHGEI